MSTFNKTKSYLTYFLQKRYPYNQIDVQRCYIHNSCAISSKNDKYLNDCLVVFIEYISKTIHILVHNKCSKKEQFFGSDDLYKLETCNLWSEPYFLFKTYNDIGHNLFAEYFRSLHLPNGVMLALFTIPTHNYTKSAIRFGSYITPMAQLVLIYLYIWIKCQKKPESPTNFKIIFHGGIKNNITYLGGGIKRASLNYLKQIDNNWCIFDEDTRECTKFCNSIKSLKIKDFSFKEFRLCIVKKLINDPVSPTDFPLNSFGFCPRGENKFCNVRKIRNKDVDNSEGHYILCEQSLTIKQFIEAAIKYPETLIQKELTTLYNEYFR